MLLRHSDHQFVVILKQSAYAQALRLVVAGFCFDITNDFAPVLFYSRGSVYLGRHETLIGTLSGCNQLVLGARLYLEARSSG